MKRILFIIFLPCAATLSSWADNKELYRQLDQAIQHCDEYVQVREKNIADLNSAARYHSSNTDILLDIIDDKFRLYYAYQYDSAMAVVKETYKLAQVSGNKYYQIKSLLHRTLLLASVGFYSDAEACLDSVSLKELPQSLRFDYYYTQYQLYSFWTDYYNGSEFKNKLIPEQTSCLEHALKYATPQTAIYFFLKAALLEIQGKHSIAERLYKRVLSMSENYNPLYGSAAYNLANISLQRGDLTTYEHYLLIAAISDIKNAVKENTALQDLAMYIFHSKADMAKAEKYITFTNKDVQHYNSRLRMVSLARRLPLIMAAYQSQLADNNRKLFMISIVVSFMGLALIVFLYVYYRQNKKLRKSKRIISNSNSELVIQYQQVNQLNEKLLDVNQKRERLAKVYIDIYAKSISHNKSFRTLVKRKIKANQTKDLLQRLSEMELTKEEEEEFLTNFDRAFLDMYPQFIQEVNMLLRDDCQMTHVPEGQLNTELRVLALIHLGVTESSEIANLLFYSPQTIYNYRWVTRAKAKAKDTFETDVRNLCRYN